MARGLKIIASAVGVVLLAIFFVGLFLRDKGIQNLKTQDLKKLSERGGKSNSTPDISGGSTSLGFGNAQPQNIAGSSPINAPNLSIASQTIKATPNNANPRLEAQLEAIFGGKGPIALTDIPSGRFKTELERLPVSLRKSVLLQLENLQVPKADIGYLHVDDEGALFYTCRPPLADDGLAKNPQSNTSSSSLDRSSRLQSNSLSRETTGAKIPAISDSKLLPNGLFSSTGVLLSSPNQIVAPVPIAKPPIRHSKSGAPNVIYLNFGGATVSGTAWNKNHAAKYICDPFDIDGDPKTFNATEQQMIVDIWERVSEHYRPFNVDVTTEKPAFVTNNRVATALITRSTATHGQSLPYQESGGVAYVGAFGLTNFAKYYSPAFVFYDNLSTNAAAIGEAASHEVGHNMGLLHDGTLPIFQGFGAETYYAGHGSGAISWGPIMGDSYGRSVSQWSRGEYYNANNPQDQLAIIAGKLSYRTDYSSNAIATAIPLAINGTRLTGTGILVQNTDVNYYSFSNSYPQINLSVRPADRPWNDPLDIGVDVLDSQGNLVSSFTPQDLTSVSATVPLGTGQYYLRVYPSSCGSPLSNNPTGFTSYDSLGSYTVNVQEQPGFQPQVFPLLGSTLPLSVSPGGPQPYSFSWAKNGALIAGANQPTLVLTNIQMSDSGFYSSTIINGLGDTSTVTSYVTPSYGDTKLVSAGSSVPLIPENLTNTINISAQGSSAAVLNSDSTVTVLGDNSYGQTNPPSDNTNVISVSVAAAHVLALKSDGTVIGWGDDSTGEVDVPVGLSNVIAVAAGGSVVAPNFYGLPSTCYSLALLSSGRIVGWGNNYYGQATPPVGLSNVISLAAGNYHSLALKSNGTVVAWGNNSWGQINVPNGLSNVVSIAASGDSSIAQLSNGTVVTWGHQTSTPPIITNAIAVTLTGDTDTALLSDGTIINWDYQQTNIPPNFTSIVQAQSGTGFNLGIHDFSLDVAPTISVQPSSATVPSGTSATLQVVVNGTPPFQYQWQQDGIPVAGATLSTFTTPILDVSDSGITFSVVVSNYLSAVESELATITVSAPPVVIDQGSQVYYSIGQDVTLSSTINGLSGDLSYQWSYNNQPITGGTNASLTLNAVPYGGGGYYQLKVISSAGSVTNTGGVFLLPKMVSSSVISWSSNSTVPTNLTNAISVAGSANNGIALKADGTVAIWGDNSYGQTNLPPGLSNVVAVTAGSGYEQVLQNNGTVTTIGSGSSGDMNAPAGLSNVISIASDGLVNLALKSDGTVSAWGVAPWGQTNIPVGLSNVVSVAVGDTYFSMAVQKNGNAVIWGENYQMPPSTIIASNVVSASIIGPIYIMWLDESGGIKFWGSVPRANIAPSSTNYVAVAATTAGPLALKSDGTVSSLAGGNTFSALTNVVQISKYFALENTSDDNTNASPSGSPSLPSATPTPNPLMSQSITMPTVSSRTYTPTSFLVKPTATSGLPVSLSVLSGPASVFGNFVTLNGVGNVVLAANQSGNWQYASAPQTTTSFLVSQSTQKINFPPIAPQSSSAVSFPLYAVASSGLPVSFSSSSPSVLSISGSTAVIKGWGTAVVTASQAGNFGYNSASPVYQTVTIGVPQSINRFGTIPSLLYSARKQVTLVPPSSSSGLTVELTVLSGPATIKGNVVTLTGKGTVTLAANQPGNSQFLPASQVTTSFTVK